MLLSMASLATAQHAHKRDNFEGVRLTDANIVHQNGMLKISVSMEFGGNADVKCSFRRSNILVYI